MGANTKYGLPAGKAAWGLSVGTSLAAGALSAYEEYNSTQGNWAGTITYGVTSTAISFGGGMAAMAAGEISMMAGAGVGALVAWGAGAAVDHVLNSIFSRFRWGGTRKRHSGGCGTQVATYILAPDMQMCSRELAVPSSTASSREGVL